jgi:hypothetical protein
LNGDFDQKRGRRHPLGEPLPNLRLLDGDLASHMRPKKGVLASVSAFKRDPALQFQLTKKSSKCVPCSRDFPLEIQDLAAPFPRMAPPAMPSHPMLH